MGRRAVRSRVDRATRMIRSSGSKKKKKRMCVRKVASRNRPNSVKKGKRNHIGKRRLGNLEVCRNKQGRPQIQQAEAEEQARKKNAGHEEVAGKRKRLRKKKI